MIVVLVEVTPAGEAVETSREAITFARDLAAAGGGVPVDAVVVGHPDDALVGTLASYGIRRVHALTGERRSIARARGEDLRLASGTRLVATYHPSAVLRAREAGDDVYAALEADLRRAAAFAAGPQ